MILKNFYFKVSFRNKRKGGGVSVSPWSDESIGCICQLTQSPKEKPMIKSIRKIMTLSLVIFPFLFLSLSLTACQKEEGPAEEAGKKVDQAVEETQEEAKKVQESVEEKANQVVEETKEEAKQIKENVEEAAKEATN
jgi:predicted small secreted protein